MFDNKNYGLFKNVGKKSVKKSHFNLNKSKHKKISLN